MKPTNEFISDDKYYFITTKTDCISTKEEVNQILKYVYQDKQNSNIDIHTEPTIDTIVSSYTQDLVNL